MTNCVHNDARDSARLFDVAMAFKQISGTGNVVCLFSGKKCKLLFSYR